MAGYSEETKSYWLGKADNHNKLVIARDEISSELMFVDEPVKNESSNRQEAVKGNIQFMYGNIQFMYIHNDLASEYPET